MDWLEEHLLVTNHLIFRSIKNELFVSSGKKKKIVSINFWSVVIFVTIFRYMLRDEKKEDDDWKSEPICGVKRPEQWISEEATVYSSTYSGKNK